MAAHDQIKVLSRQWMVRVRHPKNSSLNVTMRRSRLFAPTCSSSVCGAPSNTTQDQTASAERAAAAFGWAAAVAVVFNTVLAFIKDSYEPLNSLMKAMTGHHWITHGLADIDVFLAVGWLLLARGKTGPVLSEKTVVAVVLASVVAGAALAAWFFLV
jgi:hypothetical protein